MAVPARRTSKTKKNKRRAHQKLSAPAIHWDPKQGEYTQSPCLANRVLQW